MTPAINTVKKAKIKYKVHEYDHDTSAQSFGTEAAEKLAVSAQQVFKTLVVQLDQNNFVVALVPVSSLLSLKKLAKAAVAKKARMADKHDVERLTGYVLGGVSPLGQKKRLVTFIDNSAEKFKSIYISAGRRGLDLELSPEDLKTLTSGNFFEINE